MTDHNGAAVSDGRTLMKAITGRWAGEQLLRALNSGQQISPAVLRSLDTLRYREWVALDEALVEEATIRLKGIADLMAAGLVKPVANAMGKTMFEYEKVTDMNDALVSLSGVDRSEDDRVDYSLDGIPLPITHKDFDLNLRALVASRDRGESLDTTQARIAGRKVAEMLEYMLFRGGKTFLGRTIYGYTNYPYRIQSVHFSDAIWSASTVDGADIMADVLAAITALQAAKFYGPYWIYIPGSYSTKLDNDFKAMSSLTIRQRLMQIENVQKIQTADQMPDGHVVVMQATPDVACLVNGENLQSVQWDIEGGFVVKFKAFAIQVPLIRSTASNACGIVDIHAA